MTTRMNRGAFALPGTSLAFETGGWRTSRPEHHAQAAPCRAACPAGEDPQAWIAALQAGDERAAWETLADVNPMPAVTGRVCPHPCEMGCNRARYDEPIGIHGLERWLGDEALRRGWEHTRIVVPEGARRGRVAVVGAGPAGLSAAYQLARRGHSVTLFEKLPEVGGLLRSAIPFTRLPRDVLDRELERLCAIGFDLRTRQTLGREVHLGELRTSFDAVFLGPGTERAKPWSIDGAVPAEEHEGLALLKEWILHGSLPAPKSVAIHGGGNTAVDLARLWKRGGVADVHVVTASALPGPGVEKNDVLNVVPRELEQALEEGVVFHEHRTIQRLIVRGSRVVGLEMVRLRKLPDGSGHKRRVAFEGTEQVLHVDLVVSAVGECVEPVGLEALLRGRSYFAADEWGRVETSDSLAPVFAGGDARGDRGTVSAAIGDGRNAALAIDAWIRGSELAVPSRHTIPFTKLHLGYFEPAKRRALPVLAIAERTDHREIEGGYDGGEADAEAARCFSCGNCLACDNCWTLCPDAAVLKTRERASDGSHYVFDYDFCKGCGICATECPSGYIRMIPETGG
jgi:2-oxoacid:acceptor oxidoreductase delta subunit (pyruvate/2-ketoisovalerate family)